ncbi:MAG TPA: phosphoribosyltransferase family protein [Gemmatimonadaceae bacterium]
MNRTNAADDKSQPQFRNRTEAADALARGLSIYSVAANVVVLGLARGGVPIARQVADAIGAAFGVLTCRRETFTDDTQPQSAGDAKAAADDDQASWYIGIAKPITSPAPEFPWVELEPRARTHRIAQPVPDLREHVVIIVDDGLATGATMRAAVGAVRRSSPAAVIAAVPVATFFGAATVAREVDDFFAVVTPERFDSIASFYADYPTVSDDDVLRLLGNPGSVVISETQRYGRARRNSSPRTIWP